MKIMVGTPVYDGKVQAQVVQSMLNEQLAARELGDSLIFNFLPNCSHAAMGRNQLAHNFLMSDCERLVFLDSDVTFELGELLKIAHYSEPLVGGAYRYKLDHEEKYPVDFLHNEEQQVNESGLIEVQTLPGGFLSIDKSVFQKMFEAYPERKYTHHMQTNHCFFEMCFKNGQLWGEDSYFCNEWRKLGGKVYLDPELNLTHWDGSKPFYGHIGRWLKNNRKEK